MQNEKCTSIDKLMYNVFRYPIWFTNPGDSDPSLCRTTVMGSDYIGNMSTAMSGIQCISWISVFGVWYHDEDFPEGSISKAKNYCRNPDKRAGGPWCHTRYYNETDYETELCSVPVCHTSIYPAGTRI